MAATRYSKTMHKQLVDGVREHFTFIGAARAAGVPERTMYDWRARHPALDADMVAAQEAARQEDFELARSALRNKLKQMKAEPDKFCPNTARLALARVEPDYTVVRSKTDLHVTGAVAIEQALAELDRQT